MKKKFITPKLNNTASINKNKFCKDCGWPIVFVCCNDEMTHLYKGEDWWMYCSNQGCLNHKGEAFNGDQKCAPSFVEYINFYK